MIQETLKNCCHCLKGDSLEITPDARLAFFFLFVVVPNNAII